MVEGLKLKLLSQNLTLIINEILNNQNICKYLYYDTKNPLGESNINLPATNLMLNKVFPYPFNPNTSTDDCTNLRIFYPYGNFKINGIIEGTSIHIDIICAKPLWLINDGNNSLIRPYEIMSEIVNLFDQSLSTVGKLVFERFTHIFINDKFDCIRLVANMLTLGS